MKPDLLASADEAYGPPNPGMRCAEALVSKKDLGMELAHKLSPRSFFSSSLSSSFRKKQKQKKNMAVIIAGSPPISWIPANQLDPIYD